MIDPRADRPIYRQLADLLRDDIATGRLEEGASLPSESALMQTHDLGRPAVRQALQILRVEGLINTQRGRPSYVRRRPQRRTILIKAGDQALSRMPIDQERKDLGIDMGVPMIEVRYVDGHTESHAADTVLIEGAPCCHETEA
jgi:DNA-binding GntR family transcriptional regulator